MSKNISNDPTHSYLDINIVNNSITSTTSTAPQPLVFSTSRNTDYLSDPSQYYVSVIRWTMDSRLPIIIPQIQIPQSYGEYVADAYRTVYSFCLELEANIGGVKSTYTSGQIFVNMKTQQSYLNPPLTPITTLNDTYENPYFYVESIQYFLELVNSALETAYTTLVADWTTAHAGLPLPIPNQRPFIQYNYDGGMTLYASSGFLDNIDLDVVGNAKGSIFMNSPLYTLFNGFSAIHQGYNAVSNGKNNKLQVIDNGQTATIPYNGSTLTYNYMLTEYPVVQFWSPVSSIVFTSLGIPVNPTNTAPTNVFGDKPQIGSTTSNLDYQNIITDFDIGFNIGTEGRQQILYSTQGEYRLLDMVGNRPLSQLNIQCYWKDKILGSLHVMYLFSGACATLKLLFRKKTFNSSF